MCLISRSLSRLKMVFDPRNEKVLYIILKYLLMNNSSIMQVEYTLLHTSTKGSFYYPLPYALFIEWIWTSIYNIRNTHIIFSALSFFLQITTFRFSSYCFFVFHFSSTFSWFNFTNSIW